MKEYIICDPYTFMKNADFVRNNIRLEKLWRKAVWSVRNRQYNRTIVRIMRNDDKITSFGYNSLNEGNLWIFELNDRVRSMLDEDNMEYVIFEADTIEVKFNNKAARCLAGDYVAAYDVYGNGHYCCTIEYISDRMD